MTHLRCRGVRAYLTFLPTPPEPVIRKKSPPPLRTEILLCPPEKTLPDIAPEKFYGAFVHLYYLIIYAIMVIIII